MARWYAHSVSIWLGILVLLLVAGGCAAPRLTQKGLRASVPPPISLAIARRDTVVFVVYGDNRISKNPKDLRYDSARRRRRRAVVEAIAKESADFVIHTGALVKRGVDKLLWTYFTEDTGPLLKPRFFYPVRGNHDYKGGASDDYVNIFGETIGQASSYAFHIKDTYFIFIDSTMPPWVGAEDSTNVHARWFRERLDEASESRFLFLVLHHPVFSSGSKELARRFLFRWNEGHVPRPQGQRLRKVLADQLARRKEKDPYARTVVFSGHSHFYEHYIYRGVDFVVTGGGGAPTHTPSKETPKFRAVAYRGDHYVVVTIERDSLDFSLKAVGAGKWIQKSE